MVCLGIVRKLIFFWLDGQLSTQLSSTTAHAISFRMLSFITHMGTCGLSVTTFFHQVLNYYLSPTLYTPLLYYKKGSVH